MIEIFESFANYPLFQKWNSSLDNSINTDLLINKIKLNGINSNFFGVLNPNQMELTGNNYREHLKFNGLNSRQRALLELLIKENSIRNKNSVKIYAPEAITNLALHLRGRYPYFIGSEYAATNEIKSKLFPIYCEDLQSLSFPSASFDAILTCDVLEHIPNISFSLNSMQRVLKPGGVMLSTHPFTWRHESVVIAKIENGSIKYLDTPEYHGNPIDPTGGSLVFTIPGWEITEMCINAGFSHAKMIIILSESMGLIGTSPTYLNVLRAYK